MHKQEVKKQNSDCTTISEKQILSNAVKMKNECITEYLNKLLSIEKKLLMKHYDNAEWCKAVFDLVPIIHNQVIASRKKLPTVTDYVILEQLRALNAIEDVQNLEHIIKNEIKPFLSCNNQKKP